MQAKIQNAVDMIVFMNKNRLDSLIQTFGFLQHFQECQSCKQSYDKILNQYSVVQVNKTSKSESIQIYNFQNYVLNDNNSLNLMTYMGFNCILVSHKEIDRINHSKIQSKYGVLDAIPIIEKWQNNDIKTFNDKILNHKQKEIIDLDYDSVQQIMKILNYKGCDRNNTQIQLQTNGCYAQFNLLFNNQLFSQFQIGFNYGSDIYLDIYEKGSFVKNIEYGIYHFSLILQIFEQQDQANESKKQQKIENLKKQEIQRQIAEKQLLEMCEQEKKKTKKTKKQAKQEKQYEPEYTITQTQTSQISVFLNSLQWFRDLKIKQKQMKKINDDYNECVQQNQNFRDYIEYHAEMKQTKNVKKEIYLRVFEQFLHVNFGQRITSTNQIIFQRHMWWINNLINQPKNMSLFDENQLESIQLNLQMINQMFMGVKDVDFQTLKLLNIRINKSTNKYVCDFDEFESI